LERHSASRTGASIEFGYFGTTFEVWGNGTNYDWNMSNMGEDRRRQYVTRSEIGQPAFLAPLAGVELDWHDVEVRLNESEGSYMDIRGFMLRTSLPRVDTYENAIHMSGSELHEVYRDSDPASAWETMDPPTNQTTNTPFASGYYEPPVGGSEYPFNSTVLSTNQTGERLYFEVPQGTSMFQLYGTVGPDQGEYEVRLIPDRSENDIQFKPHSYNQTLTGESPIDANLQIKYAAWLDPRVNYAVELELLEEGKRTDIHGASFWSFVDTSEGRPELEDWYSADSDSGLSGGQIAGIVVGSVAGAALIGLAIWLIMRRRNRTKAAKTPVGKGDVESRST